MSKSEATGDNLNQTMDEVKDLDDFDMDDMNKEEEEEFIDLQDEQLTKLKLEIQVMIGEYLQKELDSKAQVLSSLCKFFDFKFSEQEQEKQENIRQIAKKLGKHLSWLIDFDD